MKEEKTLMYNVYLIRVVQILCNLFWREGGQANVLKLITIYRGGRRGVLHYYNGGRDWLLMNGVGSMSFFFFLSF